MEMSPRRFQTDLKSTHFLKYYYFRYTLQYIFNDLKVGRVLFQK